MNRAYKLLKNAPQILVFAWIHSIDVYWTRRKAFREVGAQMNKSGTGPAHMKCVPVEGNILCVMTASKNVGKDKTAKAGDGAMLHWRASETSLPKSWDRMARETHPYQHPREEYFLEKG